MEMRPIEILLVEDNPGDARLTREAFSQGTVATNIHHARDGEQAIAFLRRQGSYSDARTPDIVILDLNLPRRSGREVLEDMKSDPALRQIPVIVLTSSQAQEDVLHSYRLHANCFITKPGDLETLILVAQSIEQFWFKLVRLPSA
jgi:two-component system, chemotaxis family, response regulator Rcp1